MFKANWYLVLLITYAVFLLPPSLISVFIFIISFFVLYFVYFVAVMVVDFFFLLLWVENLAQIFFCIDKIFKVSNFPQPQLLNIYQRFWIVLFQPIIKIDLDNESSFGFCLPVFLALYQNLLSTQFYYCNSLIIWVIVLISLYRYKELNRFLEISWMISRPIWLSFLESNKYLSQK